MRTRNEAGLTLIELLVAMGLGAVMLAALGALFLASSRSNAVVGQAVQNQTSLRVFLGKLDREVHNAATFRLSQNNASSTYSSVLDIRTGDGKCIRWVSQEKISSAIVITRQEMVGAPVTTASPITPLRAPPLALQNSSSHFFGAPYTSLTASPGVKYLAVAGRGGQATLVGSSIYPATPPSPITSPCW